MIKTLKTQPFDVFGIAAPTLVQEFQSVEAGESFHNALHSIWGIFNNLISKDIRLSTN